jgi:hypothetical protein
LSRAVKASSFFGMVMGLLMLGSHVACLKNWMDAGPEDYFSYPFVFTQGVRSSNLFNWCRAASSVSNLKF